MSSLAGRPLCVYASHLHIVQWSVTWCSAAQLPADRLPSYITAERATFRFQVDVTLEGYHSGCSALFYFFYPCHSLLLSSQLEEKEIE